MKKIIIIIILLLLSTSIMAEGVGGGGLGGKMMMKYTSITIPSYDLIDAQLSNGAIITTKELAKLPSVKVDLKTGTLQLAIANNTITDLNLKSQGLVDIRDLIEQKDNDLQICHNDCKNERQTRFKKLKQCILSCIYPK